MKKTKFIMLCIAVFSIAIISCKTKVDKVDSKDDIKPIPPKDNIVINGLTYEFTGEVQIMDKTITVTGSTEYGGYVFNNDVTLKPFIMGKYEVTQELYEAVMKGQKVKIGEDEKELNPNPSVCTENSDDYKNMLNGEIQKYRPVEIVASDNWYNAIYFCNVLSELEGLTKAYEIEVTKVDNNGNITEATVLPVSNANGYRIPTNAEWEYAARGGAKATPEEFKYLWAGATTNNVNLKLNKDLDNFAWYLYNSSTGVSVEESVVPESGKAGYGTHQVGKKSPNFAGLFDMSGNITELCCDWNGTEFEYNFLGGDWNAFANYCSVISNISYSVYNEGCRVYLGFRICRNVK